MRAVPAGGRRRLGPAAAERGRSVPAGAGSRAAYGRRDAGPCVVTAARCRACHRPLSRPSWDGYGPTCRRKARAAPRMLHRGRLRPITTIPDIATWEPR